MRRNQVFAAILALLMGVSLTACGRESTEATGSELENGVAAIENAMTTKPGENSSTPTEPEDPFYRQFQQQYDVISDMGIPTGRIVLNGWPHGFGSDGGWVKDYAAWLETVFA